MSVRTHPLAGATSVRHRDLDQIPAERVGLDGDLGPFALLHGLARVAHQVDQDLLDLDPVGPHGLQAGGDADPGDQALLPGPDEGQRARLLDQPRDGLEPALRLAAGDELPQAADDLTGPQGLLGGLVEDLDGLRDGLGIRLGQQAPAAPGVVGDGAERLVQLVGQGGGHRAHRAQARDVDELGLQFLEARLGPLPLGQVVDEAGEEDLLARAHLADGELHRKGRAVRPLARHDPVGSDDAALPGAPVVREVAVVLAAHRLGHQHAHVPPDGRGRGIAEEALGRRAEGGDGPRLVDDDHGLGHGVEDRAQVGLAGAQVRLGLLLLVDAEDDAAMPRRPALRVEAHPPARAQPADVAVRPHDPVVDLVAPARPQGPLDGIGPRPAVVGMHQGLGRREGGQSLGRHAEEPGAGRRDRDAAARDVQGPDADAHLVQGPPEFLDGRRAVTAGIGRDRGDGVRHRQRLRKKTSGRTEDIVGVAPKASM